jgi:HEAT repeat protein
MRLLPALVLGLAGLVVGAGDRPSSEWDTARLAEMLRDRDHPRTQSQAALLLVQSHATDADELIRLGLQQTETPDVFQAVAEALQISRDNRFNDDLLAALAGGRAGVRQAAADTLAVLADSHVLLQLQIWAEDAKTDLVLRQAAVGALGKSGRKTAVPILLHLLKASQEELRQAAVKGLEDLSGLPYGSNSARWQAWWDSHKGMTNEAWLEDRLAYQTSRARRLEEAVEAGKHQLVQLHQQLYARLTPPDRPGHVQALADHDDPAVRELAATWCAELLTQCDQVSQRLLVAALLRLCHDSVPTIQRQAVLALGRVNDIQVVDHLQRLIHDGSPLVRQAAARALTQGALGSTHAARQQQKQVIPILQKALEDPAVEVVVEAAEDLGLLGAPEAGPILICLLSHPAAPVRLTAVQALERVADSTVLDGLLKALEDPVVTIRFSLIGALGHALDNGPALTEAQRGRLVSRLVQLLQKDTDPGVRSRAATVLGECGTAGTLSTLWHCVLGPEDQRVQEKAWAAMMQIVARNDDMDLLRQWDRTLANAGTPSRRLQFLTEICASWKKNPGGAKSLAPATELLILANLDQGKWAAALPLIREQLSAPGSEREGDKRLNWFLIAGRLAWRDGNKSETLRICLDAQPFLTGRKSLAEEFERLRQAASRAP